MYLLAVNGSPRKHNNTAQLLERMAAGAASAGMEAEVAHLASLVFGGCASCFACKLTGGRSYGRCALRDGLTPLLEKAHRADVLVLGTPFYFVAETSLMRAFQERLWFQYYIYSAVKPPLSPRKKATALIYTMNVREEEMAAFGKTRVVETAKNIMEKLFAPCRVLLCCDTWQFDDYDKYDHDRWDVAAKRKRRKEIFPGELEKAFALGVELASC